MEIDGGDERDEQNEQGSQMDHESASVRPTVLRGVGDQAHANAERDHPATVCTAMRTSPILGLLRGIET